MKRSSPWMWLGVVGLLLGCGGAPDESQPQVLAAEPERIEQTILREMPDGSLATETSFITVEEQRAQIALRDEYVRKLRSGISQQDLDDLLIDSGCAGSSLWLFGGSNLTGKQLCLFKQFGATQGWLDLNTVIYIFYPTYFTLWGGKVRSLYSGVHAGSLLSCTPTFCWSHFGVNFGVYERMNSVPATDPFGGGLQLNQAYLHSL